MSDRLLSHIAIASMLLLSAVTTKGDDNASYSRPILSSYSLELGSETALSTYLTPLRNNGVRGAISGRWSKRLPANPDKLTMHFSASINGAWMHPKHLTTRMQDAGIDFDWTLLRTWHIADNVSVSAGGGCGVTAGALIKMSNSNNPIAAYADAHLAVAGRAAWATRMGRMPIVISESVSIPSLSIFFSPEYAEPYYSIYLGYHNGLVHPGWWGNHFGIDNLIAARLVVGKRSLDVGYRFKVDSSWVNHINTQRVSHSFVIGVTFGPSSNTITKESQL